MAGVSETTFRFDDLLERLIGPRKALILTVTVSYNERILVKIYKVKGEGRIWERPGTSFQLSPPHGLLWAVCDFPRNDV